MTELETLDSGPRSGQMAAGRLEFGKKMWLEQDFEEQLEIRKVNRHELGRIARELKPHYLFYGNGNGWTAYITRQGLEVRTVDRWIESFEIKEGTRPAKAFGPDVRSFAAGKDLTVEAHVSEPADFPPSDMTAEVESDDPMVDSASTSTEATLKATPSASATPASAKPVNGPRKKPKVYALDDHRKAMRTIVANQVKAYFTPLKQDQSVLQAELKAFFHEIAGELAPGLVLELKESK